MPLIDIEKEIEKMASSEEEKTKLRKAACLGLKAAVEDVERLESQWAATLTKAETEGPALQTKAFVAAIKEVLVFLRPMLSRVEKGQDTHPKSSVMNQNKK